MLSSLLNSSGSSAKAGPSNSPRNRNGNATLSVPKSRSASPDSDIVALDAEPPTFRTSKSPEKARQNGQPAETSHNPMSIANLASPGRIQIEGQPSIPSGPPSSETPRASSSSHQPERPAAEPRSSQRSEDVTMDEGNGDEAEDEDMGDTTIGAGDEEGEDDEEGEAEEDDEDSEDDEEDDSGDDEDEDIELVGQTSGSGGGGLEQGVVKTEPGEPTASGDTVVASAEGEVNNLEPKKQKSRRKREASEDDMPPPPPPMQTIRLEYNLRPEGEDSEWNVLEAAQAAGLVPKWASNEVEPMDTDEPPRQPPTQLEGSGTLLGAEGETAEQIAARFEAKYDRPQKKAIKKKKPKEDYDFNDDFIDDSEIAIDDAETHVPRPVKEGFFVHAGAVELMSATQTKTAKKPQAKKARIAGEEDSLPSLASATASRLRSERRTVGTGTSNDPLSIDDEDGLGQNAVAGPSSSPIKRDNSPPQELIPLTPVTIDRVKYHAAVRDPKYLPPFPIFPPEVQQGLLRLRKASEEYPWTTKKNPFPTVLRPAVRAAGKSFYENEMLSERNEERRQGLITSLCSCLPYNATTLRKLFYRLCQQDYWDFLQQCEDTGIERMESLVKQEQDKWISRYEEGVEQYKSSSGPNGHAPSSSAEAAMVVDNDEEEPSATAPGAAKSASTEPKKLSVWSPEMKETFGQLIDNFQDMVDLNKQLSMLELSHNRTDKEFTETNMKSRLYKRVIDIFPEGYTSSTQVSRYSSSTRKNNKKQQPE